MMPRPPASTLFPYTTLFRSRSGTGTTAPWRGRRLHFVGVGGAGMSGYARAAAALGATVTGSDVAESPFATALDRKSTRLNSSHVEISYAVFCLKKKTVRRAR